MEAGKALMVLLGEGSKVLWKAAVKTASDIIFRDRMSRMEAEMVLDVTPSTDKDKVRDAFLRIYCSNSKENGGSPYIQSRALAAYTVLSNTSLDPPDCPSPETHQEANVSILSAKNKRT
ncbi:hypothetical protein [Encephalitozoon cuniculi GB-M1]|uniref:Uncharacterized protein n=2 Tax=Encephalitozoon cuniculi TaxID=6035 RepID=Q8SU56_ENCCU|nr:uncharacterized protein ECU11_0700 [Encephalitozoon cuniculi GB-M1]AGE95003.1 hypothetical protein ECU11_0700 [Encephalitozoon cuniculi]KMV65028.1 hypothetical protein M970_110690 [Encephalitozoon cuniculi EcunIII-L]UYI26273.1 hypothetical protein J0A71_01g00900 [Encephalitozoon cuniculi]CAD25980.1 hypothetical protein [Encephalitozoon cuniculi GB-M1]